MDSDLQVVSGLLKKNSIRYCYMRNPETIQIGSDVDIYIDSRQFSDAINVFESAGFHLKTPDRLIPYKSVMVKFVDGRYLVLDLHKELVQGNFIYMDGLPVLERAIENAGHVVPNSLDLLIILLMHSVIGKGVVQEKHLGPVKELCSQYDDNAIRDRISDTRTWYVIESVLNELRQEGSKGHIPPSLRSALEKALSKKDTNKKRRSYLFWVSLNKRLSKFNIRPRAPFYVFIGPDGTGKSTLNNMLEQSINGGGAFRAVTQYMGPWGHYRIKLLGKYRLPSRNIISTGQWFDSMRAKPDIKVSMLDLGRVIADQFKKKGKRDIEGTDTHRAIRDNSKIYLTMRYGYCQFKVVMFFLLLFLETVYRFARVYSYRRKGIAVIGDRYLYDLHTGGMHSMNSSLGKIGRVFSKIFPDPTKGYVLMAPMDVILSRKDDLEEEELEQFLTLYKRLACEYGFSIKDTTRPVAEIVNEILEENIEQMASMSL